MLSWFNLPSQGNKKMTLTEFKAQHEVKKNIDEGKIFSSHLN